MAKSAMVGIDGDETLSRQVSTGRHREYIGLTLALTIYISSAILGTEPGIYLGSVGG
jgi:hypothetical protein